MLFYIFRSLYIFKLLVIFYSLFYLTQLYILAQIVHFIKWKKHLHIGIIPDGNRRWSKCNNKTVEQGYYRGFNIVYQFLTQSCHFKTFKFIEITLFVCSKDNLIKRTPENVAVIHDCLWKLVEIIESIDFEKLNLGINIIGNLNLINDIQLREKLKLCNKNGDFQVNLAIGYDCFEELQDCFVKLKNSETLINTDSIRKNLWVTNNIDLVIRSGYEKRTSGFFPLQTQYAEWFFLKTFWPDFSIKHFLNIILEFSKINRRFGK